MKRLVTSVIAEKALREVRDGVAQKRTPTLDPQTKRELERAQLYLTNKTAGVVHKALQTPTPGKRTAVVVTMFAFPHVGMAMGAVSLGARATKWYTGKRLRENVNAELASPSVAAADALLGLIQEQPSAEVVEMFERFALVNGFDRGSVVEYITGAAHAGYTSRRVEESAPEAMHESPDLASMAWTLVSEHPDDPASAVLTVCCAYARWQRGDELDLDVYTLMPGRSHDRAHLRDLAVSMLPSATAYCGDDGKHVSDDLIESCWRFGYVLRCMEASTTLLTN